MLPVGTEVYYNGMYGRVRFACEQYMTICIREFPNDHSRDVCLILHPSQYDQIILVHSNNAHQQ